jgi:hypothetical protein
MDFEQFGFGNFRDPGDFMSHFFGGPFGGGPSRRTATAGFGTPYAQGDDIEVT